MLEGREKAERIVRKILSLDASGVYELEFRIPKSEEEKISKAYALIAYAKVLSRSDPSRAAEIAREALRLLPEKRDPKVDELVRRILSQALRILSVDAYSYDKEASKAYLERLIEVLKDASSSDLIAFRERAKAYYSRLFSGDYQAKKLLELDLKDPIALVHAIHAALALEDYETLKEIFRRGILYGTFSGVNPAEIAPALDFLYSKFPDDEKLETIIAFFSDKDLGFKSPEAKFAYYRSKDLRPYIREKYRNTALEVLAILQDAREDSKYLLELEEALRRADVSESFRKLVEAEMHLLRGFSLYEAKNYEEALEEALKATHTDNLDLLVAAYRLAIETSLKLDKKVALKIIDFAYNRLRDYKRNPSVARLLKLIDRIRPLLLLNSGSRIEAFVDALKKSGKKKK